MMRLSDPMSGYFMLPSATLRALAPRLSGVGFKILLDHPQTKDRVAAIVAAVNAHPPSLQPLLPPSEWAALKRICG